MVRAYLGLGGNVGDRLATLAAALKAVDDLPSTAVIAVSRVYESESWPSPDQPAYANAVAVIDTGLEADILLGRLQEIERDLGRTPAERSAPRTVDIDIVLFGDEEWESDALQVPHPRFAEREFVVAPLLEADPFAALPDGTLVSSEELGVGRITGVLGVLPGFEDVTRVVDGGDSAAVADFGEDEEWVTVAEEMESPGAPQAELIFKRTVLEAEGIPFAWDPYAPEMASNPYGLSSLFRLKVPSSLAERARRVLAESDAAVPVPEDGSDLL